MDSSGPYRIAGEHVAGVEGDIEDEAIGQVIVRAFEGGMLLLVALTVPRQWPVPTRMQEPLRGARAEKGVRIVESALRPAALSVLSVSDQARIGPLEREGPEP